MSVSSQHRTMIQLEAAEEGSERPTPHPLKDNKENSNLEVQPSLVTAAAADLSRISEDERLRSSDYHTNTQVTTCYVSIAPVVILA